MRIALMSVLAAGAVMLGAGQAQAADAAAAARGHQQFERWCAPCHAPDRREAGMYVPGTDTLERRYQGAKPAALEERTDLAPAYVEFVIRHGTHAMPQFRKTEISDAEMHDIAAYLDKTGAPPKTGAREKGDRDKMVAAN